MTKPVEKIEIGGRELSRFIMWPKVVRDGTHRCFTCGQIDEPEHHSLTCEEALQRQRLPTTWTARGAAADD